MPRPTAITRMLFVELIDYAGLFPPAQLDLPAAVRQYADHLRGPHAWMLGRFVVPVARLDAFESAAAGLLPHDASTAPWRLSGLGAGHPAEEAELVRRFNERHADPGAGAAVVDTLETRVATPGDVARAARAVPAGIIPYLEIPLTGDPRELLASIAGAGAHAKVRTGGVTRDAFPPPASLAQFLRAAADAGVPFKATAGLHHPLRGEYRLTYDPASAVGTMYGFLNVFLAAGLAARRVAPDELERLLGERDPAALCFDDRGVSWHGHTLGPDEIRQLRSGVATAFGSCSFDEPVADLQRLNLL